MTRRGVMLGVLLVAAGYGVGWAQSQQAKIEQVAKTTATAAGQPIEMVPSPEITAVTIEIPAPITNAPYHRHPYQRLVYVLDGELGVQTEGGETKQYSKGSLLIEMRDLWHRPVVTSHAKVLVIDFAPREEPNQITRQQ